MKWLRASFVSNSLLIVLFLLNSTDLIKIVVAWYCVQKAAFIPSKPYHDDFLSEAWKGQPLIPIFEDSSVSK